MKDSDDESASTIGRNICSLAQEMRALGENLQQLGGGTGRQDKHGSDRGSTEPSSPVGGGDAESDDDGGQLLGDNSSNDNNNNNNNNNNSNNDSAIDLSYSFSLPASGGAGSARPTNTDQINLAGGQDNFRQTEPEPDTDQQPTEMESESPENGSYCSSFQEDSDGSYLTRTVTKTTKTTTKTTTVRHSLPMSDADEEIEEDCDNLAVDDDDDDNGNNCEMVSVDGSETDSKDESPASDNLSQQATCQDTSYVMHLDTDCEDNIICDEELDEPEVPEDVADISERQQHNSPVCLNFNISLGRNQGLFHTEPFVQIPVVHLPTCNCESLRNRIRDDEPRNRPSLAQCFRQVVDVSGYRPEDIEVIITGGIIAVRAGHLEFDSWPETGVNMYSDGFCDCYSLPDGVDPDSVKMNFTQQGLLIIEAPMP